MADLCREGPFTKDWDVFGGCGLSASVAILITQALSWNIMQDAS